MNLYQLTDREGLSQVSVKALFKDRDGFLWIGTNDGLNRFDSKSVVRYYYRFDNPNSLASNEINGICEDRQGRMWFAHHNWGISIFDKKTGRFTRFGTGPHRLSTLKVYGLLCDKQGYIVARTATGLSRIDPNSLTVHNYDQYAYEDGSNVDNVDILERDGYYWFGSKLYGLTAVDKFGRRAAVLNWDKDRFGQSVNGLCALSESELLVTTEKGMYRCTKNVNGYSIEAIMEDPGLFSSVTQLLSYQGTHYVWVATASRQVGLFILDIARKKIVRDMTLELELDNLLYNGVSFLLQDQERNVFIGTERGLNIYSPYNNLFDNYGNVFKKQFRFVHPVSAIHETGTGNLLIGTQNAGAFYFNVQNRSLAPLPIQGLWADQKDIVVYHFTPLGPNQVLMGTSRGVFELTRHKGGQEFTEARRLRALDSLAHLEITAIHLQDDSTVWIASLTDGLFLWNRVTNKVKQYRKHSYQEALGPVDDQVQNIVPAKDGTLIICTKNGFSLLDPMRRTFRNFHPGTRYPLELPRRNIRSAYDDGAAIWLTTHGAGVQRFDKKSGRYTAYSTSNGLPNDVVYALVPDRLGRVWMTTNNGLAVLSPQTGEVKSYAVQDGLPDNQFNERSAFVGTSGKIYFSTIDGLFSADPDTETKNPYKPPVALTRLVADDGKQDTAYNTYGKKSFTIPAGFNTLSVEFAALSFAAPGSNRYRVRLEGFDTKWFNLGNKNEVQYSNLPPGKYTLKVQVATGNGNWSDQRLDVHLIMLPFWYQSLLFKILAAFALIALVLASVRLYYRVRLRKQHRVFEKMLAIERERQRIAAEIHDDIGAGLSGARLLTELTRRKMPTLEAQEEVGKIHTTLAELSRKLREVIWSLNIENDDLECLIFYLQRQAQQLFEGSAIRLKVSLPAQEIPSKIIKADKRRHIYLSVKEALHNCIKHSNATHCHLAIQVSGNMLHITVSDDGDGFVLSEHEKKGNGLAGMKKRMMEVDGDLVMRVDERTEVHFSIPIT